MLNPEELYDTQTELSIAHFTYGLTQKNLLVEFGSNPATDGTTIYFPRFPNGGDNQLYRAYQRWTIHEVGHVDHTDFGFLRRVNSQKLVTPMLHSIWNAIEDPWMEGKQIDRWNGANLILGEGKQLMHDRGMVKDGSNHADIIPMMVLAYIEFTHRTWSFTQSFWERFRDLAEKTSGKDLVCDITSLIDAVYPTVSTSRDNMRLAMAIHDLLPQDQQDQTPSPGEGYDFDGDLQQEIEEGERRAEEVRNQQKDENGQEATNGSGEEGEDPDEPNTQDSDSSDDSSSGEGDKAEGDTTTGGQPESLKSIYRLPPAGKVSNRRADNGTGLANALKPYLLSSTFKRRTSTRGRIRPGKLWRAGVGNPKIFEKKQLDEGVTASVGLLIDLSQSMTSKQTSESTNIVRALSCGAQLADATRRLKVPCGIWGFGDKNSHHLLISKDMKSNCNADIYDLMAHAGGGTPLTEALEVVDRQFTSSAPRRILIILTDGDPANPITADREAKRLTDLGYELVVITLGSLSWHPKNARMIQIDSNGDIQAALIGGLRSQLSAVG